MNTGKPKSNGFNQTSVEIFGLRTMSSRTLFSISSWDRISIRGLRGSRCGCYVDKLYKSVMVIREYVVRNLDMLHFALPIEYLYPQIIFPDFLFVLAEPKVEFPRCIPDYSPPLSSSSFLSLPQPLRPMKPYSRTTPSYNPHHLTWLSTLTTAHSMALC
jgi:hypothetical protein